jgi:predicted 2-oxoglutarate/Fe(II)-dependent dioxygenase YbiX
VLSIVIFLSDPATYAGGHFQVGQPPPEPATRTLETAANSAVVFRAQHVAHRVTRVEAGTRRSLVAWATARDVSQQYEPCTPFESLGPGTVIIGDMENIVEGGG